MTTFAPLYQKTSTGKVMKWEIKVEPVSGTNNYAIVVVFGYIDGKTQKKYKEITAGKVKRSILEQATSEAQTAWSKKKDKEGYVEDIGEVNKINVRPMLAPTKTFNSYSNSGNSNSGNSSKSASGIIFPCIAEPKYDGNRCISYRDNGGKVHLLSRNGLELCFMDSIRTELGLLFGSMSSNLYLDGEIYCDNLTFNEINGLTNKTKSLNETELRQMNNLKYYIFDSFIPDKTDEPIEKRKERIDNMFSSVDGNKTSHLVKVKGNIVNTSEEAAKLHDEFVAKGYEGLMLKNMGAPYEMNKRSKNMQKYKVFDDDEFTVIGFKEGVGENKGLVVWACKSNISDEVFDVKPIGPDSLLKQYYIDGAKYIGKSLTVKYQGFTDDKRGIPRFPIGKDFRNN